MQVDLQGLDQGRFGFVNKDIAQFSLLKVFLP